MRIVLVTDAWLEDFWRECPWVDEVVPFRVPGARWLRGLFTPWHVNRFVRTTGLIDQEFDLVLSPRWDFDTRGAVVMGYLCGRERHYGFGEHATPAKARLNRGYDKLFTAILPSNESLVHEFERIWPLLDYFGCRPARCLTSWASPTAQALASRRLTETAGPATITLGIGISAGNAKRLWPLKNYAQVIGELVSTHDQTVRTIVFGGSEDQGRAEFLRSAAGDRFFNAAGEAFLDTLALIHQCDLFIGNDSGAMHMAAAAQVPVIEVSCHPANGNPNHENSPERFGPYGTQSAVFRPERAIAPCLGYCSAQRPHCITTIPAATIIRAATNMLTQRLKSAAIGR